MDPIRFYGLDIPNISEDDDDELAGDDPDDQDYEPSGNSTRRRNFVIYPSDSDEDSSDEGEQASADPLAAGPSPAKNKTAYKQNSREVQRFNRKKKVFETVPCPKAVLVYNRYMGGVDLLDSMLGYYRIKVRSKNLS
ncbi:hypothetical protein HF086_002883 [Spodoptera exigua]|uniref:PiggyBac transposable element-derived protein domain-containing protein n=1 Tax=Spodoptera exigua TaxID=7107 RepID=A0A922M958_SPOEX|nr:hypothetical protein HF086_002883 [Spodoptera exigua]